MGGPEGEFSGSASFQFETHRPAAERSLLFDRLRAFATAQAWPPEIVHEIELILEEWVTDVLSYGFASEGSPYLRIEISQRENLALIVATDNGIPFDPTRHPEPDLAVPPEERPIGGLGIFLMRKLSSAMHYARSGGHNMLTIEKDLRAPVLGRQRGV